MASFNHIATTYDRDFTNTQIGRAQREIVWRFLNRRLLSSQSILEINCGTGEDAIHLARLGHSVTATDASAAMIEIVNQKINSSDLRNNIKTGIWDLNLPFPFGEEKFDIVFSNFGGLNCISPLAMKNLAIELKKHVKENGELIFVVMGRFCLTESKYFLLKGKFRSVFRRKSKEAIKAQLNENTFVDTYYYSPTELNRIFSQNFHFREKKPVGVCLPPSYTQAYFNRHPRWFSFLKKADMALEDFAWLSGMSDHYILRMQNLPA